MKLYVAARFDLKKDVQEVYKKLEKFGYAPNVDWTQHQKIKPYEENPQLAETYAIADINGVINSDLFILISSPAGTGMHSELGAAITHKVLFGKPEIYVIGDYLSRSVFFFHPSVKRRKNIEEVIGELSAPKPL